MPNSEETVFLLEPNIKKSKGGLRDVHLIQWVGQARFGAGTIQELSNRGILGLSRLSGAARGSRIFCGAFEAFSTWRRRERRIF